MASIFAVLLVGIVPIFSRTLQNNNFDNTILYDNNNYNSFSKLTIIDQDTNKTYLVDEVNPQSQNKVDKNVLATLNNVPFYQNLMPGELVLSLNSSLINNFNFHNNDIKSNYSLIKNEFIDVPVINLDFENNHLFSTRPEDISPLNLSNSEYETLLLNNINSIVNKSPDFLNLNDEKMIDLLYNKLSNSID
jgi:hypothetical protein